MLVEQVFCIVALAVFIGYFLGFLSLAVKSRLIYRDAAHTKLAVRRKLVARLEIYDIANNNIAYVNFGKLAVTNDLCGLLGFFLGFESRCLALLLVFAECGNAVCYHNCNEYSHRLEPFRLMEEKEYNLYHKGNQEYHYHRVLESFKDLLPQRVRGNLGKGVGTVFLTAFLRLCRSESLGESAQRLFFNLHIKRPFLL